MKPVTDPDLLAELNRDSAPAMKPVTDPDLLNKLNSKADIEPTIPGAIVNSVASALTFNTNDEIEAAIRSGIGLWGDYGEELDTVRANLAATSEKHPWLSFFSEIGGGALTGVGLVKSGVTFTGKAAGKNLGGRLLAAGGDGMVAGAAYAAGDAEGVSDRIESIPEGLGYGFAGGAIGGGIVEGAGKLASGVRRALGSTHSADDAARGLEVQKAAEEFEIPLTRGQATQNIKQLSSEDTMRNAGGSGRSAEILKGFDKQQNEAIDAAAEKLQLKLGGDEITEPSDVGDILKEAVTGKASAAKEAGEEAFARSEALGASVKKEAVLGVREAVNDILGDDFIFDKELTPAAMRALKEIDDLSLQGHPTSPGKNVVEQAQAEWAAVTGQGAPSQSLGGVDLKEINRVRRRLGALKGTNRGDWEGLGRVKRAFDEWIDKAIDDQLFSGSSQALDALREGNAEWAKLRGLTNPRKGDDAGAVIRNMIERDADGAMVASWLYGRSIVSPPDKAYRVAKRLKKEFGADSKEFAAIRQGMWLRMTRFSPGDDGPTATKLAKNIKEALNGKGKSLTGVLFTKQERNKMLTFANLVKRTVTPPEARNASNSGNRAAGMIRVMGDKIMAGLGLTAGGADLGLGVLIAMPIMRTIGGNMKANTAIKPLTEKMARKSAGTSAGIVGGLEGERHGERLLGRLKPNLSRSTDGRQKN